MTNDETLEQRLAAALKKPLPGAVAHQLMLPGHRRGPEASESAPLRDAAVLILLYPSAGDGHLCLPLVQRPKTMRHHSGQIGLPGGAREAGESLVDTALRETWEEIGVRVSVETVLGALSPIHVRPSGYLVHPFVAILPARPAFRLETDEVAGLIEIPVAALHDSEAVRTEMRDFGGKSWPVPYFLFGEHKIWGATAMILAEFVALD